MADFLQTLIIAATLGSLYALIALGYTMVYGILKLINFAHADIVVLGAWSSLTIANFVLPRLGYAVENPTWIGAAISLVGAMLFCATAGFIIERFAYRPIRRAPRLNALITAIGISLLLQNAGQLQYTLIDGQSIVNTGKVTGRGADPKSLLLNEPVVIERGEQYVLQITPGRGSAITRRVTAEPGEYPAGEPLMTADTVRKSQARDSTYSLLRITPPLRLPFGVMPARTPNVLPLLSNADDPAMANVLFSMNFRKEIRLPDGTMRSFNQPVQLRLVHVFILCTTGTLLLILHLLIFHTRFGTAMRAVSFSNDNAALMGISVDRVISVTFVIGAILAAAAGFLYGQMYNQLQQTAHYSWVLLGLKAFVAAVVGGIGNVRGAVVGAFLIAFIEQFGGTYGTKVFADASAYTDVAVFVLLIVVLLVKPTGIFGTSVAEKV